MKLLPRLQGQEVALVLSRLNYDMFQAASIGNVPNELQLRPHWNSSGGIPSSNEDREGLADKLRSIAIDHGFPEFPSLSSQQRFDRAACRVLEADQMLAASGGDTRRAACWAGLTILDMLDLAVWRHATNSEPGRIKISQDRLIGGNRNFLRRLWLRNQALLLAPGAEDRWRLIDKLTEDACVQIIERPSITADRRLAQTLAILWCHVSLKRADLNMERVMRLATRRIRAMAEVHMLSLLPQSELRSIVADVFDFAAAKVG